MKAITYASILLLLAATVAPLYAQQSDFETTERFKRTYDALKADIDSARTLEQLSPVPGRINELESQFSGHRALISGAFFPKTFEAMLSELRAQHTLANEKTMLISTQGTRIIELEGVLSTLTAELEQLKTEREQLLAELRTTKNSLAYQRDLVKRLNANLAANDKLVTALVDSIFLPFGKNMDALSEMQKDALGKNLEKANILNRISGIAQDNVAFLSSTKLEAKDYGVLVGQYEQFKRRWDGLKDKVTDAIATSNALAQAQTKTKGKRDATPVPDPKEQATQVDASLAEWRTRLDESFWASLMAEFSNRGVLVQPFNDGKSFSASIRSYVEAAQKSGENTKVFVDEVWIQRIDKDWRAALESESMIGKVEYASLDKAVSQLHKDRFNWQIVFWVFNVIAVIAVGWWFLTRKSRSSAQTSAGDQEAATAKPNA